MNEQKHRLSLPSLKRLKTLFSGEHNALVKGQGINFSELRNYTQEDDAKHIDWNVTAKTASPKIKLFEEEKQSKLMLILDNNLGMNFSSEEKNKWDIARETAAILIQASINQNDETGMMALGKSMPTIIPIGKGKNQEKRLLKHCLDSSPEQGQISLRDGINRLAPLLKTRHVIILLSDFLDNRDYPAIKELGKRHRIIPIQIQDKNEVSLAKIGRIQVKDPITNQALHINSSDPKTQERFSKLIIARQAQQQNLFSQLNARPLCIETHESPFPALSKYFSKKSRQ